ncbi:MAG TPA: bifunctional diguanylate cyclase/phosphodiesterase [Steroidobacteraceae bacterium]|nr:bifunctional diguanylate cyclase/phosphodiesterase [Steroidobacteraceae bacterium]
MASELEALLVDGRLQALFQPIVDGVTRRPIGFEALARGPVGSALHLPDALFAAAHRTGLCLDLEQACITAALRDFAALQIEGRLFLNVLPQTLLNWREFAGWLQQRLSILELDPHNLVVEITEHGLTDDQLQLIEAVAPLRALGCDIALDDLGAGASGLKTWSAVRPDYVKVDRYFVSGIEHDPVRAEILRSVVDMARAIGCRVVAEGVENAEQCAVALELGVDHVQGYLLGRPQAVPRLDMAGLAALDGVVCAVSGDCAEHLATPVPDVADHTPVGQVVELFRMHPDCAALAVTTAGQPIGVVRRDELLILLSKPLHPEIYNRKPVSAVMDANAVQIDARARLDQVSRLVTGQSAAGRRDDFIIIRHGSYLGMGRMIDLLRQITAQQIQAARHSNPLTGLPGNREIESHLGQWLARRRPFVACHLDLDHFKVFNDTYGYARGDQVLMHVAGILTRTVRQRVDFVGHVGGDDFVFLLRSQDWLLRLMSALEDLAASLGSFYDSEHRDAGRIRGRDRDGEERDFALLSVSVAVVEIGGGALTAELVAERLRRAKKAAKAQSGYSCVVASADGRMVDLPGWDPRRLQGPARGASSADSARIRILASG